MGTSVLGEHTATVFSVEDIEDSTNIHYCRKHKSCVRVCARACVCAYLDSSYCCIILYKYNDNSTLITHEFIISFEFTYFNSRDILKSTCYISAQAGSGFMSHS